MLLDKREKYFGDIVPKERLNARFKVNPSIEETEKLVATILNDMNSKKVPSCVDCAWCQPE